MRIVNGVRVSIFIVTWIPIKRIIRVVLHTSAFEYGGQTHFVNFYDFLLFVVKGTATGNLHACRTMMCFILHFWCSSKLLLMSGPLFCWWWYWFGFPYTVLWWRKEVFLRLPVQQPKQMDPAASSHRPWPARWVEWSKSMRTPMMAEVGSRQINHVVA